MKKIITIAILVLCSCKVLAEPMSPVGTWEITNDDEKKEQALIKLYQKKDGSISGTIIKSENPGMICTKCKGDKKDKPVEGMDVLWGLKPEGDKWSSGTILDPTTGNAYRLDVKVVDNGNTLKVTGKLLIFSRSQMWKKI